jgi:hypothetical protein
VIVRISTEGQYEVPDSLVDELNTLDNKTVEAVDASDEELFNSSFRELIELVRSRGTPLGEDDLHESTLILPPPDLTLSEAGEQFTGDGLLPD